MKAVVISCPRCGASFAHSTTAGLDAVCESCGADFRVDQLDGVPRFILRLLVAEDERRRKAAGEAPAGPPAPPLPPPRPPPHASAARPAAPAASG